MFDNFSQPVDNYCERLSPAFWAEPLNAITNLSFILAAYLAYRLYKKAGIKAPSIPTLCIMTFIVGIGSFTFHTVATEGAMLADVIPIAIFIVSAIYVIFTAVFGLNQVIAALSLLAFLFFNYFTLNYFGPTFMNGSVLYIPTIIFLWAVALYSLIRKYTPARDFFLSGLVFLVSLTARSVDAQICDQFPLGTHFIWHLLNGVVMYYVIKGLIKTRQQRG